MYKYKDIVLNKYDVELIEKEIFSEIDNLYNLDITNVNKIDYFLENISYIQGGRKNLLEILTYTKYRKKDYLLSYYYGNESFNFNNNSVGIIYAILSLLQLRLYEQAHFLFDKYEEKILEIINSNKFNVDDFIDLLIYFSIPITAVDDISHKLEELKDSRKKYIYILTNIIKDKKKKVIEEIKKYDINNLKYKEYVHDIINILRELNLHQTEDIYKLILENNHSIDIMSMLPCDNLPHYIGKILIDMIVISNNENHMPEKITKYDFKDDDINIISYKSKTMSSLHVIEINKKYIIIDCGAEIIGGESRKIDIEKFLKENNIKVENIDALIISHAHLDHYGSMDLLQPYVKEIYMTKDTYNIINIMGKNIDVDQEKLVLKKENESFSIDEFEVEFFTNNHIKGSVGIYIGWNNKSLLYTGDFSFNRQATTMFINEKNMVKYKNVDYLIMESTYGNKDIEIPYRYKKKLLNYFSNISVKNNVKVFIPAFAIGRAQECYDIIKNSTVNANIIVDGMATKISEYYNLVDNKIDRNNKINNEKYKDIYTKYNENNIIISSGGVLNEGSASEKYYNLALKDNKIITFIKSGYIDKETFSKKINPYDTIKINVIDISLSAHSSYEDLIKLVNTIQPKNLILVHGDGINIYNEKIKN